MTDNLMIDFVTERTNKKMKAEEKCGYILNKVKNNRIIVFEGGLKPQEEALLIERTMSRINHLDFTGVEILNPNSTRRTGLLGKKSAHMTVIAPANIYGRLSIALV